MVVIRTNGGELKIDAPLDTIRHYGNVDLLNIENVGTSSYHEYGYVPYAQIQRGRIVNEVYTEDKLGVQNLFLVAATSSSFNEIVIGSAPNAKLPKLDRTDVTIGDGVKVCEVQTGVTETSTATKDYVWLFGDGTVASQKVVVTSSTSKPADTGTIDAETSQGKAANELANIGGKTKASTADIETGKTEFTGGAGVEANPYVISTVEQLNKINSPEFVGKAFLLTGDLTIDVKDFTISKSYIANFNGTLVGNGHKITITNIESTTTDYSIFSNAQGMLKDLVIVNNANVLVSITSGKDRTPSNGTLTSMVFENVDYGYEGVIGTINLSSDNCGLYTQNGVDNVSFIDCDVYYDINSTAKYVGIFVGGRVNQYHASDTTLYFENCNYYGSAFAGASFGILIGNTNNNRTSSNVTIVNCSNYGNVLGFGVVGLISTGTPNTESNIDSLKEYYSSELNNFGTISQLVDDGTDATIQGYPNGQYIIKKGSNDVDYYEFRFHESLKFYDSNTGTEQSGPWADEISFKIRIRIDSSSLTFVDSNAESGLYVSSYTSYDYWKAHYNNDNSYSGEWVQTDEGVPYFYDATHKCFAIDLNSYAEQFRLAHGMGSNYKVSGTATGIANMTMFAYKNGEIVAYVNLGAAWGSN